MPKFDDHIVAGRRHHSVLGVELHRRNEVLMRLNLLLLLPKVQVPHPNALVVRTRVQVLPRHVQRKRTHPVVVPVESVQMLPRLQQEQFY